MVPDLLPELAGIRRGSFISICFYLEIENLDVPGISLAVSGLEHAGAGLELRSYPETSGARNLKAECRAAIRTSCNVPKAHMIKVQSLKRTIIAQFTVILLPLVALLLFHTGLDTRRASELADIVHLHGLAQRAQEQYRAFAQGTGEALETLRISEATLSALWESRHALDEIGRRSHTGALVAAAKDFAQMAEALEADPGIGTLHALQERIAQGRITVLETQRAYDRKLDDHMQGAIDESVAARQRVILVTLVALLVTIGFVARMIHHLSRPLEMAVAIADRIAEGGDVDEKHFNLQIDVGNLIHSLGRMYHNLRAYKSEAQAHRRGLEEKIQQLADSQSSLAEAQHLAQIDRKSVV